MLDGPEQHVERLTRRVLQRRQQLLLSQHAEEQRQTAPGSDLTGDDWMSVCRLQSHQVNILEVIRHHKHVKRTLKERATTEICHGQIVTKAEEKVWRLLTLRKV